MLASLSSVNRAIVSCARCPRLRAYCRRVAREKKRAFRDWEYWGKPVPGFGDPRARLLVVGLAPSRDARAEPRLGAVEVLREARPGVGRPAREYAGRALRAGRGGREPD